jgi:RHS repeat-associated protein
VSSNANSVASKFTYQGQELEEELGKNTYAYQWRDYDPAIGRFNKIDRFSETYQSMTPYHFSANNPIFFREIAGDSINISDLYKKDENGEYINKNRVEAFERFAKTKDGKKFLADYASKGQVIAGHEFKKDGKYHKKKIDLNYTAKKAKVAGSEGTTGVSKPSDENNNRWQINVNLSSTGSDQMDLLNTIVHENFIHVDRSSKDIVDDGEYNHSNINVSVMGMSKVWYHWQHLQENVDSRSSKKSPYSTAGYRILLENNKELKKYKNATEVWYSMWKFVY